MVAICVVRIGNVIQIGSKWVGYVGSKMPVLCCKKCIGHLSFVTFFVEIVKTYFASQI